MVSQRLRLGEAEAEANNVPGRGPSQSLPETLLTLVQVVCQVCALLRGFGMAHSQIMRKGLSMGKHTNYAVV